MGFPEQKLDNVTVVTLDCATTTELSAAKFKDYLMNFMYSGKKRVVLDLSDISYIDSAFIGALILSARVLRTTGSDLRIVRTGDHGHVWSLFEASQTFADFPHFRNIYDAVTSFSKN